MLKTVSSITNAIGALNYVGTWNASTNTPTITSSVGVKGDYYQVSVAGSTTINGISNWGVGDVIAFNGVTWQRIEGGADLNGVDLSVSGTTTLAGLTAGTALALDASKNVVSVTNTGTGNNVLADGPTLTDPNLISTINAQTGTTYTLAAADIGKVITLSNASPITLTIDTNTNVPISIGASVTLVQYNTGQVTVAGAGGVTLRATPGAKLRAQYSAGSLIKIATDEWLLVGDLTS